MSFLNPLGLLHIARQKIEAAVDMLNGLEELGCSIITRIACWLLRTHERVSISLSAASAVSGSIDTLGVDHA